MPDTIVGLLIIVIAIFPGLIGDKIYRDLVGVDWREKEWQGVLRLVGFSVVGVTLYALASSFFNWPSPVHIIPSTYETLSSQTSNFAIIFIPYSGHLLGGGIAGLLAAWGAKLLSKCSSSSAFPCAWDQFVRSYVPNHWVVIGLESGEVYAGKLKVADVAASSEERDLVLEEPALYNTESGQYISTPYQYIFIKSKTLYSIAAVNEPTTDQRIIPIGESLFPRGEKNEPYPPLST
ncbi:DUF6338 family protein [Geoalkalibacter halelectricus]|uniref:DUF6338 family protein n=1 Tax=Geoalkalibacter halelectricus TaxID=2847045 RepID=A0ABY5ZQT4_9BACT|nr:DUF6338 family protein [Geoalkalibacter halelectricus]MDO3377705.1 DUF6338 family protein [Geoalkalibacter halelectricus]UWZ81493.1 DUF6338 family protein [Geoalkalibacter halelectricus]